METSAARRPLADDEMVRVVESLGDIDFEARLHAMLSAVIPRHAAWAAISIPDDYGTPRIAAVRYADQTRIKRAAAAIGTSVGAAAGEPSAPKMRDAVCAKPNEALATRRLRHAGETIGWFHTAIDAATASSDATLDHLMPIFALALADSNAYQRERQVARTFQRAALTSRLPVLESITFDAIYEPGHADQLVGGDWYDAFVLPDGRVVFSVGDVVGSGLQAAVVMVNVRQSIRGIAHIHGDPAAILQAADDVLRQQHPDRFVTAFLAIFDPATHLCVYSNAGHPPPLVRRTGGSVNELFGHDLPLGTGHLCAAKRTVQYTVLETGALVVLYTDGLVEATRDLLGAQNLLLETVAALGENRKRTASAIRGALIPAHAPDDVAILTMRFECETKVRRWRFNPLWSDASIRVRNELSEALRAEHGFSDEGVITSELIFSEIVANLVAYAPRLAEVVLEHAGEACVLHVLDRGPGFEFIPCLPPDIFSQHGRGLFSIAQLSKEFRVERRPGGGSHARIVLNSERNPA